MEASLKQMVLNSYPYPIAVHFKKVINNERLANRNKISNQQLFLSVIDLFEVTNRFLATAALSEYIRTGHKNNELNMLVKSKFEKNLSTGDWQELFRETVRTLCSEEKLSELGNFLTDYYFKQTGNKPKIKKVEQLFSELIEVRNKKKGHSLNLTPEEYEVLYNENWSKLSSILSGLEFLQHFTLISPIEIEEHEVVEYFSMKGTNIVECFEPIHINQPMLENDILFVNDRNSEQSLKLSPLSFFDIAYDSDMEQYLWLYEGNKGKENNIKSLTYLGVTQSKNKIQTFENMEERRELLNQFIVMMSIFFKEELTKKLSTIYTPSFHAEDYYFKSQTGIIEYYVKTFFGRDEERNAIESFIANNASGFYLLKGVPGQGKTALLADIIKRNNSIHHFISENEGRNEEEAMIRSLYVQIAKKMNHPIEFVPNRPDDLKRSFSNLLQSFSDYLIEHGKKEIIVLDGLDEFKQLDYIQLNYLPEYLPKNVFIVASSRPVAALNQVIKRVNESHELEELHYSDIEQIIKLRIPHIDYESIRQLYKNSKGNPLLLTCMINRYEKLHKVDSVEETIESFFSSFVKQLREDENGTLSFHIMGLLTVSKEALTVYELSKLTSKPKYKILKAVEHISELLIKTERSYQLFHKKLAEFLMNSEEEMSFDEEEITEFHHQFVLTCNESLDEYSQRNKVYHLFELGEVKEILLLTDRKDYHQSIINLLTDSIQNKDKFTVKGKARVDQLIDELLNRNSTTQELLISALEHTIKRGYFDQVLKYVVEMKTDVIHSPLVRWKRQLLVAKCFREKGMLKEAIQEMDYILHTPNIPISGYEKMNLYLEYANAMRESGDRALAIKYYQLALNHCDKKTQLDYYLEIQHHLCDMEYVQSHFDQSLTNLRASIHLAQQEQLTLHVGKLNRIMGQVYYVLDDFEQSYDVYKKSLDCFHKVNNPINLGKIYNNIAEALVYLDVKEAEKFNTASLRLNGELSKQLEYGKAEMIKGMIERGKGNYDSGLVWINNSLNTLTEVGYKSGVGKTLYQKALTLASNGQWEEALEASRQSNELFINRATKGYQIFIIKNYLLQNLVLKELNQKEQLEKLLKYLPEIEFSEDTNVILERFSKNISAFLPKQGVK